jgi:hypothetical protein
MRIDQTAVIVLLVSTGCGVAMTGGAGGGSATGTGGGAMGTGGGGASTGGGTAGGTSGAGGGTAGSSSGGGTGGSAGQGGGTGGSAGSGGGTGGSAGSGGGTGGSAGSGGGTGGSAGSGGGTGGGTGGTGGGADGGFVRTGVVNVSQNCFSAIGSQFCYGNGNAYFVSSAPWINASVPSPMLIDSACVNTKVGSCLVSTCPADGGTPAPMLSAGDITISGTRGPPITLTPIAGGYTSYSGMSRLWDGGESISVQATGGTDVGPFGGVTTAYGSIDVASPQCPMLDCGTFNRQVDLAISWADPGIPALATFVSSSDTRQVIAQCWFATSPGSVPAAVLGMLGAADAGYTDILTVNSINFSTYTPPGGWVVVFNLLGDGVFGSFTTTP